MEARLAALLVRYRLAFLALALLFVAGWSLGARHVWFNSDYRIFFGPDNPQLIAHEQMQRDYTRSDDISFVLAPADGEIFTRDTLAALEWLTAQAWLLPYSIRVDSVTNFQHSVAAGDELVVADLVRGARDLSDAQLRERRAAALGEPLLVDLLVSARGHVTSVHV